MVCLSWRQSKEYGGGGVLVPASAPASARGARPTCGISSANAGSSAAVHVTDGALLFASSSSSPGDALENSDSSATAWRAAAGGRADGG